MAKFKEARELFGGLVAREKLSLRGVLDPSKSLEDIDPADARVGVVDILTGELRVFHNNKLVKTYRQVHCYETDLDRCVAKLLSKTKPAPLTKLADERPRAARKSELVEKAIAGRFPDGIPESLPNSELVQQIMNWLANYCKENSIPRPSISTSTVLRASGRKKKDA